jgi:hypothetical protein
MSMSYGEMKTYLRAEKFETNDGKFSVRQIQYVGNSRIYFRDMPSMDMKRINKRDLQRALKAEIDYYKRLLTDIENYSEV